MMSFKIVDLPDPLSPMMILVSPLTTAKQDGLTCAQLALEALRWGLDARIENVNPTILRGYVGKYFPVLLIHAGDLRSRFPGEIYVCLAGEG